MEDYDEDLSENRFFAAVRGQHRAVVQRAAVGGWLLCVPRAQAAPTPPLEQAVVEAHVLVPCQEEPESRFRTLGGRSVVLQGSVLVVEDQAGGAPRHVRVLFTETFYDEALGRYKAVCVEEALHGTSTLPPLAQVIFGPMFSGKTTELMRRLRRYQLATHRCLIVKYANDDRYDNMGIATHDKQVLPAVSATSLNELRDSAKTYAVIGIDEGQFFPDTVEFAEDMANRGKTVIVAALDGTFQRQGFGNILQLVPLAESVVKLSAVCMLCYQEGHYTKRTSAETALEVIGGSDKYIATCRKCYFLSSPQKRSPPPPQQPLKAIQENGEGESTYKRRLMDKENYRVECDATPLATS